MDNPPRGTRESCDLAEVIRELFSTHNGTYLIGGREILSRRDRKRVERGRVYTGGRGIYMKSEPEAFVISDLFDNREDIYSRPGTLLLHRYPVPGEGFDEFTWKGLAIECAPDDRETADFIAGFWKEFSGDGPVRIEYKNGY